MLFAVDIDGTLAAHGNWWCRWIADYAQLSLSEERLAGLQYGFQFWDLPEVRTMTHDQRQSLRAYSHAHHKDVDNLANSIPIPGAASALSGFVNDGAHLIYVTCRPDDTRQLTHGWLAKYGFPVADQVYTCERYHTKFINIHRVAAESERVILIDDMIEKMVPAFRVLVQHYRPIAISLIKRIAFVQIGREEPPTFPAPLPFPIAALPTWQKDDIDAFRMPEWSESTTSRKSS